MGCSIGDAEFAPRRIADEWDAELGVLLPIVEYRASPQVLSCQDFQRAVHLYLFTCPMSPTTIAVYTSRGPHGIAVAQISACVIRYVDTVQPLRALQYRAWELS